MDDQVLDEAVERVMGGKDFVMVFKHFTLPLREQYSFLKFGYLDCRSVSPGEEREKVMREANKFIDKWCEREIRRVERLLEG